MSLYLKLLKSYFYYVKFYVKLFCPPDYLPCPLDFAPNDMLLFKKIKYTHKEMKIDYY